MFNYVDDEFKLIGRTFKPYPRLEILILPLLVKNMFNFFIALWLEYLAVTNVIISAEALPLPLEGTSQYFYPYKLFWMVFGPFIALYSPLPQLIHVYHRSYFEGKYLELTKKKFYDDLEFNARVEIAEFVLETELEEIAHRIPFTSTELFQTMQAQRKLAEMHLPGQLYEKFTNFSSQFFDLFYGSIVQYYIDNEYYNWFLTGFIIGGCAQYMIKILDIILMLHEDGLSHQIPASQINYLRNDLLHLNNWNGIHNVLDPFVDELVNNKLFSTRKQQLKYLIKSYPFETFTISQKMQRKDTKVPYKVIEHFDWKKNKRSKHDYIATSPITTIYRLNSLNFAEQPPLIVQLARLSEINSLIKLAGGTPWMSELEYTNKDFEKSYQYNKLYSDDLRNFLKTQPKKIARISKVKKKLNWYWPTWWNNDIFGYWSSPFMMPKLRNVMTTNRKRQNYLTHFTTPLTGVGFIFKPSSNYNLFRPRLIEIIFIMNINLKNPF
jgi:hypothetical protein